MDDQLLTKNAEKEELEKALRWSREEERHEVTWIGHRLGWLLISQSFLITAAIMSQSNDYPWWYGSFASGILGFLGVWLSMRGLIAIRAAQAVIDKGWLQKETYICEQARGALDIYRLGRGLHLPKGTQKRDDLHEEAMRLHSKIGWFFIFAWASIYLLGLFSGASQGFKLGNPVLQVSISQFAYVSTGLLVLMIVGAGFYLNYRKINAALKIAEASLRHTTDEVGGPVVGNSEALIPSENNTVPTDSKRDVQSADALKQARPENL